MDARLVAWARAVKARRRKSGQPGHALPVLWLFTDALRMPDPLPAIARLPPGLCGVVFRHDGEPGRAAMALRVARMCRGRRVALTVAGDWRLAAAVGAGPHLRMGERARHWPGGKLVTAAAHDRAGLFWGRREATLVFLSPVFPTASHPGDRTLGPLRWRLAALGCSVPVLGLGGMRGRLGRALPLAAGAGAIAAFGLENASRQAV